MDHCKVVLLRDSSRAWISRVVDSSWTAIWLYVAQDLSHLLFKEFKLHFIFYIRSWIKRLGYKCWGNNTLVKFSLGICPTNLYCIIKVKACLMHTGCEARRDNASTYHRRTIYRLLPGACLLRLQLHCRPIYITVELCLLKFDCISWRKIHVRNV